MPAVPGFKREASETPSLSNIPLAESQSLHANRGGVLNSKRFSQREVDLSSIAPETSAKARKQANIDAELKQAILALKKPNRELAGKSLVETAEKRSSSVSHSRSEFMFAIKCFRANIFQNLKNLFEIHFFKEYRLQQLLKPSDGKICLLASKVQHYLKSQPIRIS